MKNTLFSTEVKGIGEEVCKLLTSIAGRLGDENADRAERDLLTGLLAIGKSGLEVILRTVGHGDMGDSIGVPTSEGVVNVHERSPETERRILRTIFGDVPVKRYRYVGAGGSCKYPLDAQLKLSQKDTTPLRQEWVERFSVQGSFRKAAENIHELLGISMSVRTAEEIVAHRAAGAMDFRKTIVPAQIPDEKHVIVTIDDKGVRMKQGRQPGARKRLDPGEKPGTKKMATVGAIYNIEPCWRDIASIASVEKLDGASREPRPPAEEKHVVALIGGRELVCSELLREAMLRRAPGGWLIALMDGDVKLENSFCRTFAKWQETILLLDFWHLREHLWEAAHALEPRSKPAREAWIEKQSIALLEGKARSVVTSMRHSMAKRSLSAARKSKLEGTISYMEERLHMMDYHLALGIGAPIGSGAAEGACGHAVRDRMEMTGMRWAIKGAQAVLDLRCIHISELCALHREFLHQREMKEQHAWYKEAI